MTGMVDFQITSWDLSNVWLNLTGRFQMISMIPCWSIRRGFSKNDMGIAPLRNQADVNGKTLLFTAAERGHHEVCKLLTQRGAKVDARRLPDNRPHCGALGGVKKDIHVSPLMGNCFFTSWFQFVMASCHATANWHRDWTSMCYSKSLKGQHAYWPSD